MMTAEQWAAMFKHLPEELIEYVDFLAERYDLTRAQAMARYLRNGKSRCEQLRRYEEKRRDPTATFRPYAPLKVSAKVRGAVKRAAEVEGVAPVRDPRAGQCAEVRYDPPGNAGRRRCTLPVGHEGEHEFA